MNPSVFTIQLKKYNDAMSLKCPGLDSWLCHPSLHLPSSRTAITTTVLIMLFYFIRAHIVSLNHLYLIFYTRNIDISFSSGITATIQNYCWRTLNRKVIARILVLYLIITAMHSIFYHSLWCCFKNLVDYLLLWSWKGFILYFLNYK